MVYGGRQAALPATENFGLAFHARAFLLLGLIRESMAGFQFLGVALRLCGGRSAFLIDAAGIKSIRCFSGVKYDGDTIPLPPNGQCRLQSS